MATAASEEAQAVMVEIVPAALDPNSEQQREERNVTAHQDYSEALAAPLPPIIEWALARQKELHEIISQPLRPAGPRRVGVYKRRCLAFMEAEMSVVAAFLRTALSRQHYLDNQTMQWLYSYCSYAYDAVPDLLRDVDPSCHTLLQRASPCFYPAKKSHTLPLDTVMHYNGIEDSKYRYLLANSDIGIITPQLTEAGALPLVGIDRPAKKILRWLAHQGTMDMNLRVMYIVGPVGIGKTTLAAELCNRLRHETSGGLCYFQCNVMAQASWGIDRNIHLLRDILSQVSPSDPSPLQANTMWDLVRLVSECLRDKRYFIIIDDMYEASDWEEIKGAFPDTNNFGSRILITTRVTGYRFSCDGPVFKMEPLNKNDSARLLAAKVVGSVDGCLPHNMKLLCDEILRRCDGIPLFIIGMADWLMKEQLQQQQEGVVDQDEEQESFAIYCQGQVPYLSEPLEQFLSSFAFNNYNWPNNDMGPLLLSMSMFPYGYKFDKDRLIHKQIVSSQWQAELFLCQLVDRNVITCVASNCKHNNVGEAKACQWQVNHFMHQFLVSKSAKIGFSFTTATLSRIADAALPAATGHGNEPSSSRTPRRLALHHPNPQLPSLLETIDLSQTRSLSVSGTVSGIPLAKFINLWKLDLEGWKNLKDEDLLQVCRNKMIFLRYLSVSNTRISKLPREIKELLILKTLDVSHTQITELPLEMFELTYLEHLDLRGTQVNKMPKEIVGLRSKLEYLLVGGEGIINSVETATRLPHDIRHLYSLQTLANVDLTKHPASFVRALGDLDRLRVLVLTWSFHQSTDRDYCEAFLSSIQKWEFLESLTIHCGLGCSMEFLGSLEKSRAPQQLKKFKVTAGRFASVPLWIDGLKSLAFVQITICNQATDGLHILGALPRLHYLILGLDFIPGQAIVIQNEGFRWLERISIDCVLPWLTFQAGAMPWLKHLRLKFSSDPASEDRVPSGITNLQMISEVVLSYSKWCVNSTSVKMTVKAVREQVAKHCNPIDLFINDVQDYDVQAIEEAENATGTSSSGTDAGPGSDDAQAVDEEAPGVAQTEITEAEN